jgi:hypothetical protein
MMARSKESFMRLSSKQWNQGDFEQSSFVAQRRHATRSVLIDAPGERVFERTCLAGQPGWLSSDSVRFLYSESGHNEKNALSSENETGPAVFLRPRLPTYWTTTRIDPESLRLQAVLVIPELAVGTLDIQMEERDDDTVVHFGLCYTGLSEAGSALFDNEIDQRLGRLLEGFGQTLTNALAAESASTITADPYQAQRRGIEYEITIGGDIDECFALACPVAELLWIDDWKFDLIYSESGRNETGCIFLEPSTGLSILRLPGANNYWYTTRYDTAQHQFDAVWLTRDLTIARWELSMTDLGEGQTRVTWSLIYTGLGSEGNRIISEPGFDRRMHDVLSFLATSLKHYVETGSIYRLSTWRKVQIAISLIKASLSRHIRR